jgi:DNA invertase Pin-like site-specific DNA recombinase
MLIGYARVSTAEQTLALQEDALTSAGCERLFTDTVSGSQTQRPGLDEVLAFLRPNRKISTDLSHAGGSGRWLVTAGVVRVRLRR